MNQLGVIYPYLDAGMWVFDDPNVGLSREPFISGIDTMIDTLTKDIKDAENGFRLIFSGEPFPGHTTRLDWIEEDKAITALEKTRGFQRGNWYYHPDTKSEGWLCPALLKYFDTAPKHLYIQIQEAVGKRPIYEKPKSLIRHHPSSSIFGGRFTPKFTPDFGGGMDPGWWKRSRNH